MTVAEYNDLKSRIEAVIFKRAITNKLVGYSLDTAGEIMDLVCPEIEKAEEAAWDRGKEAGASPFDGTW